MNQNIDLRAPQITFKMEAQPAPGMTINELRECLDRDQILETTAHGFIVASNVIKPALEFPTGALIWKCEFCDSASYDRDTVIEHEVRAHGNTNG